MLPENPGQTPTPVIAAHATHTHANATSPTTASSQGDRTAALAARVQDRREQAGHDEKADDSVIREDLDHPVLNTPLSVRPGKRPWRLVRESSMRSSQLWFERARLLRCLPSNPEDGVVEPDAQSDVTEQCPVRVALHMLRRRRGLPFESDRAQGRTDCGAPQADRPDPDNEHDCRDDADSRAVRSTRSTGEKGEGQASDDQPRDAVECSRDRHPDAAGDDNDVGRPARVSNQDRGDTQRERRGRVGPELVYPDQRRLALSWALALEFVDKAEKLQHRHGGENHRPCADREEERTDIAGAAKQQRHRRCEQRYFEELE